MLSYIKLPARRQLLNLFIHHDCFCFMLMLALAAVFAKFTLLYYSYLDLTCRVDLKVAVHTMWSSRSWVGLAEHRAYCKLERNHHPRDWAGLGGTGRDWAGRHFFTYAQGLVAC